MTKETRRDDGKSTGQSGYISPGEPGTRHPPLFCCDHRLDRVSVQRVQGNTLLLSGSLL